MLSNSFHPKMEEGTHKNMHQQTFVKKQKPEEGTMGLAEGEEDGSAVANANTQEEGSRKTTGWLGGRRMGEENRSNGGANLGCGTI